MSVVLSRYDGKFAGLFRTSAVLMVLVPFRLPCVNKTDLHIPQPFDG